MNNEAYDRILEATGCGNQRELAARLDVPESEISDSRRRGIVSEKILLALVEKFQVNPQWVRTGEKPRYMTYVPITCSCEAVEELLKSDAFGEVYGRILAATGCKDQQELAECPGVHSSEISYSKCRGFVSRKLLLILVEQLHLNPQWVRTGEGDKLLIPYEPGSTLILDDPVTELQRKLKRVELLCRRYDCGRGVWKQIDENRELLEFLLKEAPELMQWAPFIEVWIGDTDVFLNCLAELLELEMPEGALPFPRSWPGRSLHAETGLAEHFRRLEQNGGE